MTAPEFPSSPDQTALSEFRSSGSQIVAATVARATEVHRAMRDHGRDPQKTMASGIEMIHRILAGALAAPTPQLLEDQVEWARTRLPHDGVPIPTIIAGLVAMRDTTQEILSDQSASQISPFLSWMIERLKAGAAPQSSGPDGE